MMGNVMTLLAICSAFTSLATEAAKKIVTKEILPANILAAIISVIIALFVGVTSLIMNGDTVTSYTTVEVLSLAFLSWLVSMLGYDKVKDTVERLSSMGQIV